MVKKNKHNNNIKKKPIHKKMKLKNSLSLLSPLKFLENNNFIYNIKFYTSFKKFSISYNKYKITDEELLYLNHNIDNISKSFSLLKSNPNTNFISNYFQKLYPYIKEVEPILDPKIKTIEEIMKTYKKTENISLLKIKDILNKKYNIKLGKTTIYRILKNKLKYRFRKTIVKNKDLNELKYKLISFIFIKIIIRANET